MRFYVILKTFSIFIVSLSWQGVQDGGIFEFLLEIMELNERIDDWQQSPQEQEGKALLQLIDAKQEELKMEYVKVFDEFHLKTCTDEQVKSLEEYLAQQQYLDRLQAKLNQYYKEDHV